MSECFLGQVQVLTHACDVCRDSSVFLVPKDCYLRWLGGLDSRLAFQGLNFDIDLFVTGIHEKCWKQWLTTVIVKPPPFKYLAENKRLPSSVW